MADVDRLRVRYRAANPLPRMARKAYAFLKPGVGNAPGGHARAVSENPVVSFGFPRTNAGRVTDMCTNAPVANVARIRRTSSATNASTISRLGTHFSGTRPINGYRGFGNVPDVMSCGANGP